MERLNVNVPLTLIRGDTQEFKVVFVFNDEYVTPNGMNEDDKLSFSIRKKGSSTTTLTSTTTIGDGVIKLTHEQTKDLKPGKYEYDIELKKEDMSVVKTLQLGELEVKKDVTI